MTQPESRLSQKIQVELRKRGAFCYKNHGNEHMQAGLPDVVGCYRGVFFGLEVKMPGNDASKAQRYQIKLIRKAGGFAYVVRSVKGAMRILAMIDTYVDSRNP